ncbi:MAG: hypothetical protein AAB520_01015 [Patescibacteria group bacterium]|mgnify:FL=1
MLQRQVSKTLIYSDIFDFPLTLEEIHKYLITDKKNSIEKVKEVLQADKKIKSKNGFYCLAGREKTISLRGHRQKESAKKIKNAYKIIKVFKFIPSIKLLGVSGSVSMKNADKNDDIDLFIISEFRSVWLSRLATVCILKLLRIYRGKNSVDVSNKFCLNMIIDEKNLVFQKSRQDIYSAHEIVQILPLLVRDNIYQKFINANLWTKKYLANFEPVEIKNENIGFVSRLSLQIVQILNLEKIAKLIQIAYMGKIKGKETIRDGFLAFHPHDPRKKILRSFKMKLREYNFTTLGH